MKNKLLNDSKYVIVCVLTDTLFYELIDYLSYLST